MPQLNIANTTISDLSGTVQPFKVNPTSTDGAEGSDETFYDNPFFTKYLGYYKKIPELKKAIDALSLWTVGRGFDADSGTKNRLGYISGWGEDTFESIMWNMLVVKKFNGDSYAELIRDPDSGELVNIKPLDPSSMRTVIDKKGIIKRYEQRSKVYPVKSERTFKPNQILHLVNDRIADEVHGISIIEACQWVIDARNEAMNDWKRISHRSTIRVLYVDMDNRAKLNQVKADYAEAIKRGELLIIPAKPGEAQFEDITLPPIDAFLQWIRYLEDFFYQAVGVPKVILGGSSEFTEASAKIAYLTFEQVYAKEQRELEADLWNQAGIKIIFNKPVSLKSEALSSEEKNTGQVGFQANDSNMGGKTALTPAAQ